MAWVLAGSACATSAARGAPPPQPHSQGGITAPSSLLLTSSLLPSLHSPLRAPHSRRTPAHRSGGTNSSGKYSSVGRYSNDGRSVVRASGENGVVTGWEPFVEALRYHHRQPLEEPGETPGHARAEHQDTHPHSHSHSHPHSHSRSHPHSLESAPQAHSHSHAPSPSHGLDHSHGHQHSHSHEHEDSGHTHSHAQEHSHGHSHSHEHEDSGHTHSHAHEHTHGHTNGHANGHAHHSHNDHSHEHQHTDEVPPKGTPAHQHQHQHEHQVAHSHPPAPKELQEAAPGAPAQPALALRPPPLAVAPRRASLVTLDPSWRARGRPLVANAGAGKVLFIDAQTAGVAGDMMVAALLDLGVPPEVLGAGLEGLGMDGFTCHVTTTERSAITATRFVVQEVGPQPFRDYGSIRRVLQHQSALPPGAAAIALSAFRLLAEAEASVHGVPVDSVHFHEVGAIDSIVDIAACAIALDYLGWRPSVEGGVPGPEGPPLQVAVSRLPMGRGIIRGAAHGPLPCPAPATLDVLCRSGLPTFDAGMNGELVTPTGACVVGALVNTVTSWPAMVPERAAYGAGTKSWRDRPNLLRLVLGSPLAS